MRPRSGFKYTQFGSAARTTNLFLTSATSARGRQPRADENACRKGRMKRTGARAKLDSLRRGVDPLANAVLAMVQLYWRESSDCRKNLERFKRQSGSFEVQETRPRQAIHLKFARNTLCILPYNAFGSSRVESISPSCSKTRACVGCNYAHPRHHH
jgi:hypothetical protein